MTKASGQKLTQLSKDSELSTPLQNSPESEFREGWREKRFMQMSEAEIDRWFYEIILLVYSGEGVKM